MNTAVCAEVMRLIATKPPKRPNWMRLGQLVMKYADKMPEATTDEIAERALAEYRDGSAAVE